MSFKTFYTTSNKLKWGDAMVAILVFIIKEIYLLILQHSNIQYYNLNKL